MSAWACEAYGPEGAGYGALCFLSGEIGIRLCESAGDCRLVMTAERQRVFQRIQELAAQGDETAACLAGEFAGPEQLLGGGETEQGG